MICLVGERKVPPGSRRLAPPNHLRFLRLMLACKLSALFVCDSLIDNAWDKFGYNWCLLCWDCCCNHLILVGWHMRVLAVNCKLVHLILSLDMNSLAMSMPWAHAQHYDQTMVKLHDVPESSQPSTGAQLHLLYMLTSVVVTLWQGSGTFDIDSEKLCYVVEWVSHTNKNSPPMFV